MIEVGTIQAWWERSRRYPALRKISLGFLKPIGYCFILDQIERLSGVNKILEFGHGFNPTLFAQLSENREVHGLDDYQQLPYFPQEEEWKKTYLEYTAGLPHGHFHRGLLGPQKNDLPDGTFDVVCSVSVLEELFYEDLANTIGDAHRILKPGGYFINSFDFVEGSENTLNTYLRTQVEAGFSFDDPFDHPISLARKDLAFEDQWTVMEYYNMNQPDVGRQWQGNWCTLLTVSRRRSMWKSLTRKLTFQKSDVPTVTLR
jgi:SAM-dependent methyltransferase